MRSFKSGQRSPWRRSGTHQLLLQDAVRTLSPEVDIDMDLNKKSQSSVIHVSEASASTEAARNISEAAFMYRCGIHS
jgi:hypothetical protein